MRILLADDDEITLILLTELLQKDGHEVETCSDGHEALRLLDQKAFDVLIVDWIMPGLSGIEVCKRLRADVKQKNTYVILLTGRAQRQDVLNGLRAGANDYVIKPVGYNELETRLRSAARFVEMSQLIVQQQQTMVAQAKMAVLGEMASGVAHEINNPLAIIISKMQQLERHIADLEPPATEVKTACEVVVTTAYRIAKVVRALHTFTASEASEMIQEISAKSLIDDVLMMCQARIIQLGIELVVDEPSEKIVFVGQRGQLIQVLLNLIENSIYAVSNLKNKVLRISSADLGERLEISVADSGPLISDEIKEKLMQPFFTTKEVGAGMGLGLSIAKGIISQHGGTLYLDQSHSQNRFVFVIPKRP